MLKYFNAEGKWMFLNNVNIIYAYFFAIISVFCCVMYTRTYVLSSSALFKNLSHHIHNTFYAQLNSKHSFVFPCIIQWDMKTNDMPQLTAIAFIENVYYVVVLNSIIRQNVDCTEFIAHV
jgi:hypothetical protein